LRDININTINISETNNSTEGFEIYRSNYDKASEEKVSLTDITIITIQYYAASVSFRNPSNLQLPWQYYFMAVTNHFGTEVTRCEKVHDFQVKDKMNYNLTIL